MYVVVIGNPRTGGRIVGPFRTKAEAAKAAAGYNAVIVKLSDV